jgi:ankyrin repeat protein
LLCFVLQFLLPPVLASQGYFCLIAEGREAEVGQLLSKDPVLANMTDELGRSPLHVAVINGHLDMVNILIRAGATVNCSDRLRQASPLHYAAFHNYPRIMLFLLSRGADPGFSDNHGNKALHIAAANGCRSTVEILLQHGAKPDVFNKNWQTPLHLAASAGSSRDDFPHASNNDRDYLEVARLLLLAGAASQIQDIWQNQPLTIAWRNDRRRGFAREFDRLVKTFARTR